MDTRMTSEGHVHRAGIAKTLGDVVLRVDHVAVAVEDLDSSVRWYEQCLGFRAVERRTTKGTRTAMNSVVMQAGETTVVLINGAEADSQVSRFIEHFGPGVQHLALAVTDLEQALELVRQAGGEADTPVIEDEGIRQVFLRRDPGSGVRVELIERRGGSFTDQSVMQLFNTFEERRLY